MDRNRLTHSMDKLPRYSLTVVWAVLIAVACLVDFSDMPDELPAFEGMDKVVHFLMYFVLSLLFIWEYRRRGRLFDTDSRELRLFTLVLLLSAIWGGLMEYLQSLTSYRGAEQTDLTADVAGALFAFLLYYIFALYRKNDKNEEESQS
ncbi:MAG: VanZ family protein [Bacteroidales bacterium]|nr:VanZ family protein [Bacteroidales bacterium]